jgi:hypothetical protein
MAGEHVTTVITHPAENCVESDCPQHPTDTLVRGEWLVCKGTGGTQECLIAADAHCCWCGRRMLWDPEQIRTRGGR